MEIINRLWEIIFQTLVLTKEVLFLLIGLFILSLACQTPSDNTTNVGTPDQLVCNPYGFVIGMAFFFLAFFYSYLSIIAWVASKLFAFLEKRKSKKS
jgi:TRAP-type mannitol/chloroaromatic compound transport system permease large subunit